MPTDDEFYPMEKRSNQLLELIYKKGYDKGYDDAKQELKQEPLSDDFIRKFAHDSYFICNDAFKKGVRWAETQHKIGENCEQS